MKTFTKLWQWMMILLISSSVLVAQAQKTVSSDKAPEKEMQKKEQTPTTQGEQIQFLKGQGLTDEEILKKMNSSLTEEQINTLKEKDIDPESLSIGELQLLVEEMLSQEPGSEEILEIDKELLAQQLPSYEVKTGIVFDPKPIYGIKTTTVTLGTDVTVNTTTSAPTPYGTYFKNFRQQYLILASELTALGVTADYISALGFNVDNVNNCSPMPNYTISMMHTAQTALTTAFEIGTYTEVWTHPNFLPVTGWNTHYFCTPFYWDGVQNILIDICSDIIPGSYTQNASVFYTATTGTNTSLRYQSDVTVACGTTLAGTVSVNRANMQITYGEFACREPQLLLSSNITTNSADLAWTPCGIETLWNLEWGPAGFVLGTGTMVTGLTSPSYSLIGLDDITSFDFYVQADCGTDAVSLWAGPATFQTLANPLSGAYTINSGLPTSGTNFTNFTDFASALNLGGVSGSVTVDVVIGSGPYMEQVMFGVITGVSAVNTVTINGNDEILQYLSTNTNERGTLKFNGSDYFIVEHLVIQALGSASTGEYGWAVWLTNNADYNTFTNCQFIATQAATATNFAAFVASSSATGATTTGQAVNYLTIDGCIASGGYYGMSIQGPSAAPWSEGLTIINTEVSDFYYYGLYLKGQNNAVISGNDINRSNRTSVSAAYMLYLYYNFTGSEITKNRIYDFAPNASSTSSAYGIYSLSLGAATGNELLIANNVISGYANMNGANYGIYLSTTGTAGFRVFHNTVSVDNVTHTGSSLVYVFYGSGASSTFDVKNNIFAYTTNSTGTKYCLYFSSGTFTSDYNVLFRGATAGTNNTGYVSSTAYATLGDWKTANGGIYDLNSSDADPLFVSPVTGDFSPQNPAINDMGTDLLTYVPDDILGTARTTTPDPGAFEFIPAQCLPPSDLNTTGITAYTAQFNWTAGGSETLWNVEYGPDGFTPGTGTTVTGIANPFYIASSLIPASNYDWYVQADCGGGDLSSWAGPSSFMTLCVPITVLPWTEDFEGMPAVGAKILPICWSYENVVGTSGPTSSITTGTYYGPYSGTHFFYMHYNNTTWAFTPGFDLLASESYDFSFYMMNKYITTPIDFLMDVAYGGSQNSAGMTNILASGIVCDNSAYTLFKYTFTPAASGTYYFGVKSTSSTTTPWYLSFDDFKLEVSPLCPSPFALTATNILANSADLGWTESGTATTWDIELGAAGFVPTGVPTQAGVTANPYNYGGLSASTPYDFYVRADCGGGGYSTWSGPKNFVTACASYTAPFEEHFQNTTIPLCWEMYGPQAWLFTTTWPGYGAAGLTDHTGTGGSFTGVDGSGTASLTGITLLSPFIDVTALTVPQLRFFLFNNNINDASYQTLTVDLWDGAAWNPAIYFWGPTDNDPAWVEVSVVLSTFTITGDIQFRFVVDKSAGSPFYDDLIIDDVYVEEAPTCPNPAGLGAINITTAQADLTWTSYSGLSDIEFGAAGFVPTGTPTDAGVTSPFTKMGLAASSSYDFYVRDDCGGGDYSNWVGPYNFDTPCAPFIAPYTQDFTTWPPLCWDLTGGTYSWIQYTTGVQCAEASFWGQTSGNTDIMTTNTIDVSGLTNPSMEFYWSHLYSATYPNDALEVLVSDDNGLTWTQVWYKIGADLNSNDGAGNTTPGTFVSSGIINLTAFGNNLLIQFYGHSGYGPDCFVDNFSVFNAAYGTLDGYVYKYGTTTPIENASVVIGVQSGLTGIDGYYSIPSVLVGTYDVDCSATGYSGATATGVVISDGVTTSQNFYLQWAEIAVNPVLFNESMAPESLLDKTLTITNNAPAALNYSSSIDFLTDGGEKSKAAGDILIDIDVQATNLDNGCLGVEFDGTYYYVSGRNSAVAPYKLYKHDQTGALVATYDQPTQATSLWGLRDLAFNAGYIYGGSEDGFYQFDIATGTFTTLFTGNLGITCIRALAYYPPTGNFLAVNWSGAITEFTSAGTIIGTYTAPAALTGIYGMAWDSWNSKLWLFDQSGTPQTKFFEYDITTQALTGISYQVPMLTGLTAQIAGGAFFSTSLVTGKAVLGGLVQGTVNDHVFAMELNVTETWLSITANGSGTVPGTAKGFVDATVHFDAAGLTAGTVKTANIVISSNALNAPTVTIPVTMNVVEGYTVSGNVYYGITGIAKPMETNTTVILDPHGSTATGAAGYYEINYVLDGSYKLLGSTTKIGGGLQAFDATLVARYLGSIVAFSDLQKRAADVNLSNTVTSFDGTLLKRKLGGIATPQWTAPVYVFDGPFPSTPLLDGIPVTVSGADVMQELRTICSGDLNSSFTPPAE
jgi:hypothetical protein